MGVMVIACYRAKPGKEADLLALTKTHVPLLVSEGLAENRPPLAGRAKDGTIVEVFVWKSPASVEAAHQNANVAALWAKFAELADFRQVKDLAEAGDLFAEFDWLKLDAPCVAQKTPIGVEVEAGKTYFWCSCGQSKNQPFCDGSHKGSVFSPMKWTAPETKRVFFCACKQTKGAPLCDGSHKAL